MNRIAQANTVNTNSSNCWGETYTIDSWGNLTNRSGVSGMTGCFTEGLSASASSQNQLSILSYDSAGNGGVAYTAIETTCNTFHQQYGDIILVEFRIY